MSYCNFDVDFFCPTRYDWWFHLGEDILLKQSNAHTETQKEKTIVYSFK